MSDSQSSSRLIKLFYTKYLKGLKNLKGLVLNSSMDEQGVIIINISNPNDMSFGADAIIGYVEEIVHDFTKFINGTSDSNQFNDSSLYGIITKKLKIYIDGDDAEVMEIVYLNKQDLSDVQNRCKMIREFKYEEFESKCKVSFREAYLESSEGINVELDVILLTPEWEGRPLKDMAILTDKIKQVLEDDGAADYEHDFASSVMSFFWNTPLIIDREYMWTAPILNFYTPGGKRIRPWS